jgi:hypothetical protein
VSFDGILSDRKPLPGERPYAEPISSARDVLRETARETLETNPLAAIRREAELDAARNYGRPLTAEAARARLRESRLDGQLTVPDQGITQEALDILMERKRVEMKRAEVFAQSPGGFGLTAAQLGVGFATSLVDPINIASGFIPVVGQARYSRWLAGARGFGGRTAIRAGVGALEGTVGAALVEPIIYSSKMAEQADYSAADSLLNIAFGTVLGGGLHVIGGAGLDAYRLARGLPAVDPDIRPPLTEGADMEPMAPPAEGPAPVAAYQPSAPAQQIDAYLDSARQIWRQLRGARDIDLNDAAALSKVLGERPKSLSQFIRETGGIVDQGGELSARDITSRTSPGLVRRDTGVNPGAAGWDAVRERVFDAGYFPGKADYNEISDSELLDALAADVSGQRVWPSRVRERLYGVREARSYIEAMEQEGFSRDMTPEQIADRLRAMDDEMRAEVEQRIGPDLEAIDEYDRFVSAANVAESVSPQTREAALRAGVAQAVTGREVDVEPIVNMDPSRVRGRETEAVDAARAAAERNASPEQATLVDFDAAAEVPEPKPRAAMLDDAEAALGEALTEVQTVARQGAEAYKYARGGARPRVRRTINQLVADAESQATWRTWYQRHEQTLVELFGDDADLFQKLLSATSQATGVKGNVSLALKAYKQLMDGEAFTGYLPAVIKNLERIRSEQPLAGAKISQYGKANEGDVEAIAVDRHIAMLFFSVKSPTARMISVAKDRIRTVAARLGWQPREVQAALWAFNQVRMGIDPARVESYDKILESRAEFIAELRAGNITGERAGVSAGAAADNGRAAGPEGEPAEEGVARYARGVEDYGIQHRPPGPGRGAPLHDLTGGGEVYPDDIYSPQALRFYGDATSRADRESMTAIQSMRGKPDAVITMYRAVPNAEDISEINAGDWVTISRAYAKEHGESSLRGEYKILSKKVKARELFTNGDSINEFGYWPEGTKYSRADTADALSAVDAITAAVRASFGDATDALLEAGRIQVVDGAADVPGGPHPEDVRAVYAPDGTSYIVASNMPPDMVRGVVLHEVGVHAGMEAMLGADLFARTLGEIDRLIAGGDAAALRARAMVPDDTPAALVREETLAYLVQNNPDLPLVRRIIAAIKAWVFRVTDGKIGTLGEDELVSLAQSALRRQARGAAAMGDLAMASRAAIDTPAFKRWFGDSKVVDDEGRPLAVYHGTRADFTEFDITMSRDAGAWFTPTEGAARLYSGDEAGSRIIAAYVSLKNPYFAAVGESKDQAIMRAMDGGHDGIIVRDSRGGISTLSAFRPEQIKSATSNVGTFDPVNPDIRYSRGGTPAPDPNSELKPFDDAIARAELYGKAVRAAAERIGNDDAARAAMRAATADQLAAGEIDALLDQLKAENRKVRSRLRKAKEQFTAETTAETLQTDAMRAADTLANNVALDATIAKRNAALALTARTKAVGRILSEFAANPVEGLMALLGGSQFSRTGAKDSVFHWQRLYFTRWTKGMLADLERGGLAEAFMSDAYGKDVARALYQLGREQPVLENINPEAVKIARVVYKYREDARNTRNRYGAWIREMTGYITRQSHDFVKIRAAGADEWKAFVRDRLDLERMGIDGDVDATLQRLYDDFAAGRHLGETDTELAAVTQPGSLARRVSQSRVLYFKNADGEFDYMTTFGVGKLHEAILTDLSRASQQSGLLRILGPNPQDTLARVMDEVEESLTGDPKQRRDFFEARGQAEALLTMLDGRANVPGSYTAAKVSAGVRAVQAMAKLGGAVISAVTDLPVYASQLRYQGRGGLLSGIGEGVASLLGGRPKGERREILRMIDTVADGMIGGIAARFDADDLLTGNTAELMRLYFRYNGLQWWTDTLREGMELGTSNWLGNLRGKDYTAIGDEARRTLGLYSIGEREWAVIRQASVEAADKRVYVVPEAMNGVSEAALQDYVRATGRAVSETSVANARRDLSDRLRNLIIDQAMTAVIEPDVRSRYFWMRGTRPGTFWGETARFIGQFKGFPTALTRQVFGREIYGRGYNSMADYLRRGKGDMLGLAQMIVAMTAFGYIAMVAKDTLKGKTPRPPDDPQTWLAAMLQGGALGIYGDFLLGQSNRFGRNILDTMAGPTLGTIGDLDELRQRAMRGDDTASSAFRLLIANTPFLNLFYLRTTLDYLILYQIQEALDPGSLRRMERRVEREQGQEFLIAPSETVN